MCSLIIMCSMHARRPAAKQCKLLRLCTKTARSLVRLKTRTRLEDFYTVSACLEGLLIANDVDNARCYLLVHQTLKRVPTANCVVVNQDAATMPAPLDAQGNVRLFDRVLCDVICRFVCDQRRRDIAAFMFVRCPENLQRRWHVSQESAAVALVVSGERQLAAKSFLYYLGRQAKQTRFTRLSWRSHANYNRAVFCFAASAIDCSPLP